MPSSDVKDLIKEIMNNGPKSIPAHIKAVVASNKFGYKFVTEINGHLDYRFYCSGKRYNGCLPNGWGTLEEIGRAAIFAKEQNL